LAGPRILAFEEIDSTNVEARRQADSGEAGPLWITALRQSAGRGRRGRIWETGSGNLAATYLFTTALPAAQAAQVSFVAALAVADLAAAFTPPALISLKWPNDVLIAGEKTAGILVESGLARSGRLWVAVGCGVNLATPPEASERLATTFAVHMTTPPPSPSEALNNLAEAMSRWLALWAQSGFSAIADAWTQRAHGLGERCTARLANETIEGVAEGLDEDGALRLRRATGEVVRITAGDVFF
jgi:BirA family biotin operon repressor/biotin-[acetyl-CoA-carboxylase] ligase